VAELRKQPQWVLWRYEVKEEGKKPTKRPYQTWGEKASSTRPGTWTTYAAVAEKAAHGDYAGIGFVVGADDPYCGLDLDQAIDDAGAVRPWAMKIVRHFNSYTEVTPSGKGLRIWIRATLPGSGRCRKNVDGREIGIYDRGRYFTITGDQLVDTPGHAEERQEALLAFLAMYFPDPPEPPAAPLKPDLKNDDHALLEKAFAAEHGQEVEALYRGDTSGYPSQSEADMALTRYLYFWTGGDAHRIDRLFRGSGLMREKWDAPRGESLYGAGTIDKIIRSGGEIYDPITNPHPPRLRDILSPEADLPSLQAETILSQVYTARALRQRNLPPPGFVASHILPEGLVIVHGHPKLGKSFLALALAIAVATGTLALSRFTVRQGTVLYVAREDGPRRIKHRLGAFLGTETDWPETLYLINDWPSMGTDGLAALSCWLETHPETNLIILDPWSALRPEHASHGDLVLQDRRPLERLDALAHRHAASILVIHHAAQTNKGDSVNQASGTSGIVQPATAVFQFIAKRGEHEALLTGSGKDAPDVNLSLIRDTRTGFWSAAPFSVETAVPTESNGKHVWKAEF
jgi:hypothetical protein